MSSQNQQWTLRKRPHGLPSDDTWSLDNTEIPHATNEGDVVVKALYITVDPYLRSRIAAAPIGEPTVSGQVAEVVESKSDKYTPGDKVVHYGGWRRYSLTNVKESGVMQGLQPLPQLPQNVPVSSALGVLGMPGMTAYFGTRDILKIQPGETVVVSGAAGAVGSLVGQIAKHLYKAGKVIGTAGGAAKCKHLVDDLGFDAAIDYKQYTTAAAVAEQLQKLAPNGVDAYFDNTGGHVTDAIFDVAAKWARVAVCGQISQYNATETPLVPSFLAKTIYKSITVTGFIWSDFAFGKNKDKNDIPVFYKEVAPLIGEGKIQFREHVVEGFEKVPQAFKALFSGENTGKLVVKV